MSHVKKRILVVDDEAPVREVLRRFLEQNGYEAVTAESGEAALQRCRTEPVDLMLLDMNMPGLTGLDVLVQLQRIKPSLPVVMLTGNQNDVMAVSSLKLGAYDYVMKPPDFEYLKLTIQSKLIG